MLIPTKDISNPMLMLRVHFVTKGNGFPHIIKEMGQKCMEWAGMLTTCPLPDRDAWLIFSIKLYPAMS